MSDPIFGYDVSEHQPSFDHARAYDEGYRFAIVRCSEGTYEDKHYADHVKAIKKVDGLLYAAYHRTGTTSTPEEQAATVDKMVGDKSVPIWLDTEDHPNTEARHHAVAKAIQARGYRVAGSYLPKWYWSTIGKVKIRNGPLWASNYVAGTGYGSALYGKVAASQWAGYGGQKVVLLQFTDKAKIAGQTVDASSFRGTMDEFRTLFNAKPAPQPAPKPAPAPAPVPAPAPSVVTTLAGTPLDLSGIPTGKGPRFPFRDRLTNTAGVYPGCVCECIPRWVALVEALAKESKLPVPLLFWEGSYIVTTNSGNSHAGGGALDININALTSRQVTKLVRICRQAGAAAWLRDKRHGGFTTKHIHVELIGCPHASTDARAQWADYKAGRDGLAAHGRDYGPKVTYITADAAFRALTKTGRTPADTQDWLDMATQNEVQTALVAALQQVLTGDLYPSPSLNPASVKKNPRWLLTSLLGWQVKLIAYIRRDMPTRAQVDQLIALLKEKQS